MKKITGARIEFVLHRLDEKKISQKDMEKIFSTMLKTIDIKKYALGGEGDLVEIDNTGKSLKWSKNI